MSLETTRSYIATLDVEPAGDSLPQMASTRSDPLTSVNVDDLPSGIVTGSQMIAFPENVSATLKSSVALSLLAAQRVATNDPAVQDPDKWIDRYNTVLGNLNWTVEGGGSVQSTFDSNSVLVHEAILPFLTAAFGGAAAGTLIVTALKELSSLNHGAPWITLFERESRRFDVSEYHFVAVETEGSVTRLKIAAARFDASYGRTQVLFFRVTDQSARFTAANSTLYADTVLQEGIADALKAKLHGQATRFIASLPDDLLN